MYIWQQIHMAVKWDCWKPGSGSMYAAAIVWAFLLRKLVTQQILGEAQQRKQGQNNDHKIAQSYLNDGWKDINLRGNSAPFYRPIPYIWMNKPNCRPSVSFGSRWRISWRGRENLTLICRSLHSLSVNSRFLAAARWQRRVGEVEMTSLNVLHVVSSSSCVTGPAMTPSQSSRS